MPRLRIDGREVEIPAGATILQAAQAAGIDIPTLCYQPGFSPSVSCMVCVVRVTGIARLLPACATLAEEGMEIIADSEEIRQARRINLELILSDHAGDCEGPCRFACPLEPDTPSLLRAWQNLDLAQAQAIASRDLILPATLGFICPAPCEKVCRRREVDAPVAIRLLHQQAGLEALRQASDNRPQPLAVGQSIAVVGAGPAGLAAASRLRDAGFSVTVYDAADKPGGGLQVCAREGRLPLSVLEAECQAILSGRVKFVPHFSLVDVSGLQALREQYAAVILAMGSSRPVPEIGLQISDRGIAVQRETHLTSLAGVYAAGGAVQPIKRLAARAAAQGGAAAKAVIAALSRGSATTTADFRVRLGKLSPQETAVLLALASADGQRSELANEWTNEKGAREASRCLHCDCRAKSKCALRRLAARYGASAGRFGCGRRVEMDLSHPQVIYEANKCICCGLCLQVSRQAGERLGLSWRGRGLEMRPAAALAKPLSEAIALCALDCAAVCPTGALALRK